MTTDIITSPAERGSKTGLLLTWLLKRRARREERIAADHLEQLPDYLLRDMGLTRYSIRHAVWHGSRW